MNLFRSDLLDAPRPTDTSVPQKKHMMCLNESTLDPWQKIDEAFCQYMQNLHLNRYFQDVTKDLKSELANYAGEGIKPENILMGNGADDMLFCTFLAVRENNESYALSLAPSYFDYSTYCRSAGLGTKFIDFDNNFDFDETLFVKELNEDNCKLGILCNPNNPTGNLLSEEKILYILNNTQKPVLIDETYFEFSGVTFLSHLEKYPNMLIVRSFSKAFSAAGLRFGYLLSNAQNIALIRKAQTIFNLSLMTQGFVLTILINKKLFLEHTQNARQLKNELYKSLLKDNRVKAYQSHTNFVTFTVGEKSAELFEYLKANDIAIRNVSIHKLLENHLRVTTGDSFQNELFLRHLKSWLDRNA